MPQRQLRLATTTMLSLVALCSPLSAQQSPQDFYPVPGYHWLSVFGASPSDPQSTQNTPTLANYTVRQVARLSVGTGYSYRLRLSNALSTTAITFADVHVARWAGNATTPSSSNVPGTDMAVTFNYGHTSVTVPPGGEVLTDYIQMPLPAQTDITVSIFLPSTNTAAWTQHLLGNTNVYFVAGDVSGSTTLTNPGSYTSRPFLTGIDVATATGTSAVVTLGDSITDGAYATVDGNTRWPDDLSVRLQGKYGPVVSVVNAGIGGNGLISEIYGKNAVARLNRDVIAAAGAKYVIVLEGINDIRSVSGLTADQLIAGYRMVIARAHEANLYVYGGTITPFSGSGATEQLRQAVNTFIRTSGAFDAVIDFDKAIADPKTPTQILAAYNSGDNLHPSVAGYQAMADAIDLSLFDPSTH